MICLAEAFDTIQQRVDQSSNESIDYVINELRKNKQTQFDPFITEIFIKDVIEKLFIKK